ncbi:PucR family transcriptional regulator [Gordonia terrae]
MKCAEIYPAFGTRPNQILTLRLGTESVTLLTLVAMDDPTGMQSAMSEESGRAVEEWVKRGVPLTTIWAAIRTGHAWLTEEYTERCLRNTARDDLPERLQTISRVMLRCINDLSDSVGQEYDREYDRWMMSTSALRDLRVREVLNGECRDVPKAEADLEYQLRHRHHIGLVLWATSVEVHRDHTLHKMAASALSALGAEQTIYVLDGSTGLFAWGNRTTPFAAEAGLGVVPSNAGVRGGLGSNGFDVTGFVGTNRQAQRVQTLVGALPALDGSFITYKSVQLLSLLTENATELDDFIDRTLGALAGSGNTTRDLRVTLEAYLRNKHSPLAAANELFVVRNTVIYRLKRAEELLGHGVDENVLETWVALVLHALRGRS